MATSSNPRKSDPNRPPQAVKFSRRTSSGRVVSLSRDDDLDVPGDNQNDYINYTVMMPPTPDNQPGVDASGDKPDGPGPYGSSRFKTESQRRVSSRGGEDDDGGARGDNTSGLDRRVSVLKSNNNKSMLLRSQTQDFDHNRWLFETKGKYGIGNAFWQQDDDSYDHDTGMSMSDFMDKPWKPLTRKSKVPPEIISPYRFEYFSSYITFIRAFIVLILLKVR